MRFKMISRDPNGIYIGFTANMDMWVYAPDSASWHLYLSGEGKTNESNGHN
jgi:hypothetical protein